MSNFYPCVVSFEGVDYPSVENAYQAAKFPKLARKIFETCTAKEAKQKGKKARLPKDWNKDKKLGVMKKLIALKFKSNTLLANKLLDTGDAELIEGNWWGDTFWGMCKGKGENKSGELLMKRRERLRSNT